MKKFVITATAMLFALGLTISAQAQGNMEKTKPATSQVQKVTVPQTAPEAAKPATPEAVPAEAKKGETPTTDKKISGIEAKKDKETAIKDKTAKEVKTTAVPMKKSGPETKVDKQ